MFGARPDSDEGTQLLFRAVAAVVCSFFGTFSNLFTITALGTSSLRSHPTTMFVLSLAASDLVFSLFNLPILAHRFLHPGCEYMCLDYHVCQYFPFFLFGNIGTSLYIMVLIALQRVFGVYFGHRLDKVFSRVNVILMTITTWILCFSVLLLPLTKTWGQFGFEQQTYSCTVVESEGETFYPFLAFAGVCLPCLIIAASYAAIWRKVKRRGAKTRLAAKHRSSSFEVIGPNSIVEHTKLRERRITRTFSWLFVSFLVCFMPWAVVTSVDPMPPSSLGWLHMATYILSWSSAFLNPIIYCVTNRSYFKAYKQFLKKLVPVSRSASGVSRRTEETGQEFDSLQTQTRKL